MAQKFTPKAGQIYQNINGFSYRCLLTKDSEPYRAIMQQPGSLWTFTAIDCQIYEDGKIDWTHSINGHFAKKGADYGPEE